MIIHTADASGVTPALFVSGGQGPMGSDSSGSTHSSETVSP